MVLVSIQHVRTSNYFIHNKIIYLKEDFFCFFFIFLYFAIFAGKQSVRLINLACLKGSVYNVLTRWGCKKFYYDPKTDVRTMGEWWHLKLYQSSEKECKRCTQYKRWQEITFFNFYLLCRKSIIAYILENENTIQFHLFQTMFKLICESLKLLPH